jgi:hypothetical protein
MKTSDNSCRIVSSFVGLCTVRHSHYDICQDKIWKERGSCIGSGQEYITDEVRIYRELSPSSS